MSLVSGARVINYTRSASQDNKCKTLDELIGKFKLDSSISKIKENLESLDKFTFQSVTTDEERKEVLHLYYSKATQYGDISAKILNH